MSNERKRREALIYHSKPKPGKINVVPSKNYRSQTDLSLAYSPGVAHPCLEIDKNPEDVYKYTSKSNLVAVISNGTAVLGLGDIGPLASKPVMEGKGLLFKIFADIDVFDIEINEKDPDKFISVVKSISTTFGGINLEDIKAPEAFKIEKQLIDELMLPVSKKQETLALIREIRLLTRQLKIEAPYEEYRQIGPKLIKNIAYRMGFEKTSIFYHTQSHCKSNYPIDFFTIVCERTIPYEKCNY